MAHDHPHFGIVLSCGNGDTMHKDAIRLPDLDYGATGKWAMNFWLKHFEGHENYDSEYILTHGAANMPISSRDHVFMFMRGTGVSGGRRRRRGVADDGIVRAQNPNDPDSYIDGKAANPDQEHIYGGNKIDPDSTINFCGRDQWTGWHEKRYYLGRIAHIAILNDGLSHSEVQDLFGAYHQQFGFDVSESCSHYSTTPAPPPPPPPPPPGEAEPSPATNNGLNAPGQDVDGATGKTSGALMIATLTVTRALCM